MKNIKYVFLGNSQNLKEIGEIPAKASETWVKESKTIFNTYCKSSMNAKYEQRNKVVGNEGNYYFTITPTNTFYIILAENDYPERQVFQLIDEMQKESIHLLVDEKGELNKIGKQSLKNLIEGYQNPGNNKIANVNADIEDIKIEMNQNLKKVVNNLEDAEELKKRSEKINESSKDFGKKAGELKRATCWQNYKWTIIIIILIIGLLLIIILPIVTSKSSDSNANPQNPPPSGSQPPPGRYLRLI